MVKVNNSNSSWLCSIVYASSLLEERIILWKSLKIVADNYKGPWLVVGNFNEVAHASEKFGGLSVSNSRITYFNNCLDYCQLIDLGFKGPKYTWKNKKNSVTP